MTRGRQTFQRELPKPKQQRHGEGSTMMDGDGAHD